MLQLALRSALPLISVATTDLLNLSTVLQHLAKRPPQRFTISKESATPIQTRGLYFAILGEGKALPEDLSQVYEKLVDKEATLVLVNLAKPHHLCFDAGVVPVPASLLRQTLEAVFEDKKVVAGLLPVLGGCTLKDVGELVRLTFARDQSCTPEGLMRTRQMAFRPQGGLTLVDNTNSFYQPPDFLHYWLAQEKPYFLGATDPRLIPRGLMFAGQPGTGKTAASKWLAKELGVPLYRLDIGTTKSKFIGECHSEDTEFLTSNGPKLFNDIDENDLLATMNTQTGALEFQKATARHCSYYEGEMVQIRNRRVDALVTPNHRMWLRYKGRSAYEFVDAERLVDPDVAPTTTVEMLSCPDGWAGTLLKYVRIPYARRPTGRSVYKRATFVADTFLRFLRYFVAEGSIVKNDPGLITLHQKRGPVADDMMLVGQQLFDRVSHVDGPKARAFYVSNIHAWQWLNEQCGHLAANKRLPRWVMDLPREQLGILLSAMVAGDGNIPKLGRQGAFMYATVSKVLAEQVAEIALRLGYTTRSRSMQPPGNRQLRYEVHCTPLRTREIHLRRSASRVRYSGNVVCFTVPNGTLLTRRDGGWLVSGNSERQLSQALAKLDQEEPCIVLLDEIEKAFSKDHGHGDSGTTTGLLSQLLWWLAEHRSRVLTVMTCNNQSVIPQELYRPGRIDEVFQFRGLTKLEDCIAFAAQVLGDFGLEPKKFDLKTALAPRWKEALALAPWQALSQAEIEVLTIGLIKEQGMLLQSAA